MSVSLNLENTGIRPYSEGHPVVGVLVTDGAPSNSEKTQEFADIVRNQGFSSINKNKAIKLRQKHNIGMSLDEILSPGKLTVFQVVLPMKPLIYKARSFRSYFFPSKCKAKCLERLTCNQDILS